MTLGKDTSHIRIRPGVTVRIRSVTLNALCPNSIQNISPALYANPVSFPHLVDNT